MIITLFSSRALDEREIYMLGQSGGMGVHRMWVVF